MKGLNFDEQTISNHISSYNYSIKNSVDFDETVHRLEDGTFQHPDLKWVASNQMEGYIKRVSIINAAHANAKY